MSVMLAAGACRTTSMALPGVFARHVHGGFLDRLQLAAFRVLLDRRRWGRPTWNSKPSRRMVSMSTERCSTPRPATFDAALVFQLGDAHGDVAFRLAHEALLQLARTHDLALAAHERDCWTPRRPRPWWALLSAMGSRRTRRSRRLVTMSPMSASSTPTTATMSPGMQLRVVPWPCPGSSNVNTLLDGECCTAFRRRS